MSFIKIKSFTCNRTLYEGRFNSIKQALEQAAQDRINLDGTDLRHANLAGASLDDLRMKNARLNEANLTGANLSEADLRGCLFTNAELYNCCLCYSNMTRCSFEGARFGGTDITGTNLVYTRFSSLSAFELKFLASLDLTGALYKSANNILCRMSTTPLVLSGLEYPVQILDDHILIEGKAFFITPAIAGTLASHDFIQKNRGFLSALVQTHRLQNFQEFQRDINQRS